MEEVTSLELVESTDVVTSLDDLVRYIPATLDEARGPTDVVDSVEVVGSTEVEMVTELIGSADVEMITERCV